MRYHRLAVLAATAVSTLSLVACGSDSNDSSSSSSSSGSSSKSGGSTIKLMTIGPTNAPGFSLPSIPIGAQIAVDEINKAGGINGHQVELITCNDKNNPNTATQCGRQAVKDKVAAVVGGLSIQDLKANAPLEQAGIPWIGLTTPDAYTQKNLWNIGGEGVTGLAAIGITLVDHGCTKIATVISAQGFPIQAKQIEAGVASTGKGKVVKELQAPANGTDFAPIIAGARSAGADCIGAGTGPGETGPMLKAISAGAPMKVALLSGGLPSPVLTQIGPGADGVLAVAGYLPFDVDQGDVKALQQKILAKDPKAPLDQFAQSGYASVKIVEQAAKGLDDITAQSLTAALPKVTGYDTGLGPVVDFSKPNPVPAFARIFNPKIFVYEAKGGKYALAQPDPIDTQPALVIMGKAN